MNRSRIKKEKSFTLSEKATHIVMPTIMHRRSCIDVIRAKIGSIMPAPAEEGFTLAEVLITLGIIGVVAAITIPGLITNIQDYHLKKKWKKVFADVANAYRLGMDDEELYIPKIEGEAYNSVDELYYRIFSNLSPLSMCVNHITNPSGKMVGGNCYNYGLGKLYNKGFNAIICTSLNGDAKSCAYNNMNGNALLKNGAILFAHGQLWGYPNILVDVNGEAKPIVVGRDMFIILIRDGKVIPGGAPGYELKGCDKKIASRVNHDAENLSGSGCGYKYLMEK